MKPDEARLRDALSRHLDDVTPSASIEEIRRSARRGRVRTGLSTVAAVTAIALVAAVAYDGNVADRRRVVGPVPSTDGGLIAFSIQDAGDMSPWIAVMSSHGGPVTRLREGSQPSWSPDGTRIAFACGSGICTMNADGSDVLRLTRPAQETIDEDPDWGPGGWIAFTRTYLDGERGRDIFIIRDAGGEPTPFIEEGSNFAPSWSPDGRTIAFVRGLGPSLEAPPGGFQLWRMESHGTGLSQLTRTGAARPDWSPDGRTIAYDEASALWTIPAEGGDPTKLPAVSGGGFDVGSFLSWSPDGERIVFMCSAGSEGNDLCIAGADGSDMQMLIGTGANESDPSWQSLGTSSPAEDAPGVAKLVCDERGMTALDTEVAAQPDGVHLEVENKTDRQEIYISNETGRDNEGGGLKQKGITEITTSMPPGEVYLSCFGKGEDVSHQERAEGQAVIRVVDPDGLWSSPELDCSISDRDSIVDDSRPDGAEADVDGLIRAIVPGIEQDDEILKTGYPLTQWTLAARIIVRDGARLATVALEPDASADEGWVAFVNACEDSGIGT